jgi:hypothetical protein
MSAALKQYSEGVAQAPQSVLLDQEILKQDEIHRMNNTLGGVAEEIMVLDDLGPLVAFSGVRRSDSRVFTGVALRMLDTLTERLILVPITLRLLGHEASIPLAEMDGHDEKSISECESMFCEFTASPDAFLAKVSPRVRYFLATTSDD